MFLAASRIDTVPIKDGDDNTLSGAIGDHFAAPGQVIARLRHRADAQGSAAEDVATAYGVLRLSVTRADPKIADYIVAGEVLSGLDVVAAMNAVPTKTPNAVLNAPYAAAAKVGRAAQLQ